MRRGHILLTLMIGAWVFAGLAYAWLGWNAYTASQTADAVTAMMVCALWLFALLAVIGGLYRWCHALCMQITEHERTETELRESAARHRELFENASDMMYTMNLDKNLTSVNRAYQQITGYTRDELIGMSLVDILAPEYLALSQLMRAKKEEGTAWTTYEVEMLTKSGERVPVEVSTRLIYQNGKPVAVQGIARDISERKRVQEALKKAHDELENRVQARTAELTRANQTLQQMVSELHQVQNALHERVERLHMLMHLIQVMSSSLDREDTLGEIARAAAKLMNAPEVSFWLVDEAAQTLEPSAFSNSQIETDFPFTRLSFTQGGAGWVATHRQPLNVPNIFEDERFVVLDWWRAHQLSSFLAWPVTYEGHLLAILALYGREPFQLGADEQNLLDSFVAQAAITIHNADLYTTVTRARDAAETATRAKSEFLANMSHELRTPLHVMLSCADLGRSQTETTPLHKLHTYFEKIHQSGGTLLTLLNELLDLAKLEADKMSFDFRLEDLRPLLAAIADEFQLLMSERSITLHYDPPPRPILAAVDVQRFMQVLRNLLSNAVKFSPENGTITIDFVCYETTVWVRIHDQGPGIPPEELETIFDKFVQSSLTKTGAGGTGLGLAICRQIMTAHRGHIWAEANPQGGAVFTCELPQALTDEHEQPIVTVNQ